MVCACGNRQSSGRAGSRRSETGGVSLFGMQIARALGARATDFANTAEVTMRAPEFPRGHTIAIAEIKRI